MTARRRTGPVGQDAGTATATEGPEKKLEILPPPEVPPEAGPGDGEDVNGEEEREEIERESQRVPPASKGKKKQEDDDYDVGDEEDAGEGDIAFSEGVGRGVPEPDHGNLGEQPLDMRTLDREVKREGPLGVDEDDLSDQFQREWSKMGPRIRYRVTRLEPSGMPPSEKGPFPWVEVGGLNPNPHEARGQIERRYGGGRYEIVIAGGDPADVDVKKKVVTMDVGGEPIPQTMEGRMWYQRQYGLAPPLPQLAPGEKPSVGLPGLAGVDTSGPLGLLGVVLQMQQQDREREILSREKDKDRDNSLAAAVIGAMGGKNTGQGWQALLALAPVAVELLRSIREDRRRDTEAHEKRMDALVERLSKPQGPLDMMQMIQPILALTQKRAELEMTDYSKRSDKMFEVMLSQLRASGHEEDASILGSIATAIKEGGGDLLRGMTPLLVGLAKGQTAKQTAEQLGVQPQLMRPSSQPRAMPPRVATRPTPQAAPLPAPSGGGAPSPSPVASPQAPAEGVAGASAPDETAPPPQAPVDGPRRLPNPGQFAMQMSVDALRKFIYFLRAFAESNPDPVAAWDVVLDGQALGIWYGFCPPFIRERIEQTDPTKPFSIEAVLQGAPEDIVDMGREFDLFLQGDGAGRQWLADFLDCGPWTEEEGEPGDENGEPD